MVVKPGDDTIAPIVMISKRRITGEKIDYARTPNAHVLLALLVKLVRQN
jgi:hypothetical protein